MSAQISAYGRLVALRSITNNGTSMAIARLAI